MQRPDPCLAPSAAGSDIHTAPTPNPFAELSAADQAVVFDIVSIFMGEALGAIRPGDQEQDAA